jgi:hypothetical protein
VIHFFVTISVLSYHQLYPHFLPSRRPLHWNTDASGVVALRHCVFIILIEGMLPHAGPCLGFPLSAMDIARQKYPSPSHILTELRRDNIK